MTSSRRNPKHGTSFTWLVECLPEKRWESIIISHRKEGTEHRLSLSIAHHFPAIIIQQASFKPMIHGSLTETEICFILTCHWLAKNHQLHKQIPLIAGNIITLLASHGNLYFASGRQLTPRKEVLKKTLKINLLEDCSLRVCLPSTAQ